MTAGNPHRFNRFAATCVLLLVACTQSNVLARSGGLSHDSPWNPEHIDSLPPEIRDSVLHSAGPGRTQRTILRPTSIMRE